VSSTRPAPLRGASYRSPPVPRSRLVPFRLRHGPFTHQRDGALQQDPVHPVRDHPLAKRSGAPCANGGSSTSRQSRRAAIVDPSRPSPRPRHRMRPRSLATRPPYRVNFTARRDITSYVSYTTTGSVAKQRVCEQLSVALSSWMTQDGIVPTKTSHPPTQQRGATMKTVAWLDSFMRRLLERTGCRPAQGSAIRTLLQGGSLQLGPWSW
jgi:hypothetical protein